MKKINRNDFVSYAWWLTIVFVLLYTTFESGLTGFVSALAVLGVVFIYDFLIDKLADKYASDECAGCKYECGVFRSRANQTELNEQNEACEDCSRNYKDKYEEEIC